MRRSSLFISGLLLLVACGGGGGGGGGGGQPPADEETFYVNPGGSDDNDGLAPDRPFRTLFRAVDGLTAGDVVYVAPGEYPLQPTTPGEPRPTEVAEFRDVLGTAAQPVSLIADITGEKTGTDPGDVVVDGDDAAIGLRVSRSTHIIIDGFRIISARGNNGAGIQVRSGSDDVTVRNCVITDSGDGVRVENSNDALIFNNLIYGNDNRGHWRSDFRQVVASSLQAGGPGARITKMLAPGDDDFFVLKPKHSAFFGTPLDLLLQHLRVNRLLLAGVASDQCVVATAIDARMRDYDVVVARDCVASQSIARNRRAIEHLEVATALRTTPSARIRLPRR